MKKIIAILLLAFSTLAFAEASFDEIQGLIDKKQYAAAEAGLELIIKNHPNSAKAFYAMAEAQAGLGNLEKAQKALNLAKGIDPSLKFVSEGSVRKLEQAITPQTNLVTYEEPSHFWRNLFLLIFAGAIGWIIYYFFVYKNKKADDDYKTNTGGGGGPKNPDSPLKEDFNKTSYAKSYASTPSTTTPLASSPATTASYTPSYTPQPTHTTVVNNSSNDMLTGVLIGNMLSSHHDTTRVVEREVVREVPSRSLRDSSWDDTPSVSSSASSRDSSWDDTPSKKSSSWDSDSSSSSSSWSSSSDSSSSWDSGSSSSSSSDW